MAVKKFTKYVVKAEFYLPTETTPEKSISEILEGIKTLGGIPTIAITKLVDDKPKS